MLNHLALWVLYIRASPANLHICEKNLNVRVSGRLSAPPKGRSRFRDDVLTQSHGGTTFNLRFPLLSSKNTAYTDGSRAWSKPVSVPQFHAFARTRSIWAK